MHEFLDYGESRVVCYAIDSFDGNSFMAGVWDFEEGIPSANDDKNRPTIK